MKIKFLDTGEELEVTEASMLANTKVWTKSWAEKKEIFNQVKALCPGRMIGIDDNYLALSIEEREDNGLWITSWATNGLYHEAEGREFRCLPSQPTEPLTTPDNEPVSQPSAEPGQEITPEALEAEGWAESHEFGVWGYRKGRVHVEIAKNKVIVSLNGVVECDGVKSMPDLLTLDSLVNGVAIPS